MVVVVVVVYDSIDVMHKKGENWNSSIELWDYTTALVHNYMYQR